MVMTTAKAGKKGQAKVPKGLATMEPAEKARIIKAVAKAGWEKCYREHPKKLKARRER